MPILKRKLRGYGRNYTITISGSISNAKGMTVPNKLGKTGYYFVDLKKNNKTVQKRVDKLVAFNWILKPKGNDEVIHRDGNKVNNYPHNLRWATEKEFKAYKPPVKETVSRNSIKSVVVLDNHTNKKTTYNSPKEASEKLGIKAGKIRKALRESLKINNLTFSYS